MAEVSRPSEIPKWMWEYVLKAIKDHNFDSSHDQRHFVNVYNYAKALMDAGEPFEWVSPDGSGSRERAYRIVLHAAFLHDIIDRKYVDEKVAIVRMIVEFMEQNYPMTDIACITEMISNMSFSKRKARRAAGEPEFGQSELVVPLRLLCDADALDAYRVERVIAYQNSKHPGDAITVARWCKTIFVKRVLIYLSHNFIQTPTARMLALPMHAKVAKFVEENYPDVIVDGVATPMEMFDY